MIKKKSEQECPVIIDLTGPEGNAHVLMGYAHSFSKQLGLDSDKILKEMRSGDYENLVNVMEKHFGSLITMYR